jgi:hypothetical protein
LGNMTRREHHEMGLAVFVAAARRDRFRQALGNARLRAKLQHDLYHYEDRLDTRFAERHVRQGGPLQEMDDVHTSLARAGAPDTCFVVGGGDLDGREVPLRDAVGELMTYGAGFISCIPSALGAYIGEDGHEIFVLRRHRSSAARS